VSLIELTDRAFLVTGGSRGIGAATAIMLARAGADVAITYRTRRADAESVAAQIGAAGRKCVMIATDLARREECERAVTATVSAFGGLDGFVANAGIWPVEPVGVRELTDERWKETVTVNLDAVFYGCRAALRAMREAKEPPAFRSIVIVSSTAAQRGEAFHADYAATKGAINAFVKSLAVEAAPEINVNAVAPGWVDTEMAREPYERDGGEGKREIERGIPLGRVASAEDVAGPIVFLCSELARHVTGEILNVNGGSVLCG